VALGWRLAWLEHATLLDGGGNIATGARWNSPGRGVVYAAFNLSLCVLEILAQLYPLVQGDLPELIAVRIEFPDAASRRDVQRDDLPTELGGDIAARRCRQIGDEWLAAGEHLICLAPSIVVPQERNVLINPAHALMSEVRIVSTEHFRFDPRLARPPLPLQL
jgi:RES domain-containing protein